jgi:predicted O-methyltransferase YrrM
MVKSMRSKSSIAGLRVFVADLGKPELMVEIGSWIGESAVVLAGAAVKLICVDPWEDYLGAKGSDVYAEFLRRTKTLSNITSIGLPSIAAAKQFDSGQLDAVYIDGLHDYDSVKQDIIIWRPKLKPGGVLAGHDYGKHAPGVMEAVEELIGKPSKVYSDTTWRA